MLEEKNGPRDRLVTSSFIDAWRQELIVTAVGVIHIWFGRLAK